MEPEEAKFSELQLGIRELFRIVIPGAYAVILFSVLPGAELPAPATVTTSSSGRLAGAIFFGLVGYALRPHECWWPYSSVFWKQVQYLNAEIARFAGEGDHTALYKYLLTVGPTSVSDRVHYFSSSYYMLITLSLYSVFAAIAEFFIPAFQIAYAVHLCGWATALFLSMAAVATQLFFMFVTGVRNRREYMEKFRFLPAAMIGGAGAFISLDFAFFTGTSTFSQTRAIWIVLLALLAFVLANLGNKQWRSIINEQIVHVRKCREDIADLVRSNEGAS